MRGRVFLALFACLLWNPSVTIGEQSEPKVDDYRPTAEELDFLGAQEKKEAEAAAAKADNTVGNTSEEALDRPRGGGFRGGGFRGGYGGFRGGYGGYRGGYGRGFHGGYRGYGGYRGFYGGYRGYGHYGYRYPRFHGYPSYRTPWWRYSWYGSPYRYPWYSYGYYSYPTYTYPGYSSGYYYWGNWTCTGYDTGWEEHSGGHTFMSTDYNAAYSGALNACLAFHGNCNVSCVRTR